jgi:hypothetical protein
MDNSTAVGVMSNIKAQQLLHERHQVHDAAFVELKVWRVPTPVLGSSHAFKYALAYVVEGECVLRYDNEAGKGDHHHIGSVETPYVFISAEQLLRDFWRDVDEWS